MINDLIFLIIPDDISKINIDQGPAILLSFILATFTGILAYYFKQRKETLFFRNNNSSLQFIKNNPRVYKKLKKIGKTIKPSKRFEKGNVSLQKHKNKIDILLTHYETVAIGIKQGVISENFMYSAEETIIKNFFEFCSIYILSLRIDRKSNMLKNYEIMYLRCKFPILRIILFPLEWLNSKPIYWVTFSIFNDIYFFICRSEKNQINFLESDFNKIQKAIKKISPIIFILFYSLYFSTSYLLYLIFSDLIN